MLMGGIHIGWWWRVCGVHQDQRFLRCLREDLKWGWLFAGLGLSVMVMGLMLCRSLLVSSTKGSSK
jgi:hypothetical protein